MKRTTLRRLAASAAAAGLAFGGMFFAGGGAATAAPEIGVHVAAYTDLTVKIYGSSADRIGAERLVWSRMQSAQRDCMVGLGFGFTPAPYDGFAGGPVVVGDSPIVAPLADDFGIASRQRQHAEGVEAYKAVGGNKPFADARAAGPDAAKAYAQAASKCGSAGEEFEGTERPTEVYTVTKRVYGEPVQGSDAHRPFTEVPVQKRLPRKQDALDAKLVEVLAGVESSDRGKALTKDYLACLGTAGFAKDVQGGSLDSYRELFQLVWNSYPADGKPWGELSASEPWAKAVALEKAAAAADRTCRTPLVNELLPQARPGLDAVAASPDVALMVTAWATLRAEVVAAGLN